MPPFPVPGWRRLVRLCLTLGWLGAAGAAFAQTPGNAPAPVPGSVDHSYNPTNGVDGRILDVAAQPDGKVIVTGNFVNVGGVSRNRVARLNADGTLDETFNPGTGFDKVVRSVAIQDDGKVIVGGEFTQFNGAACSKLARLNPDGSADQTFNPGVLNYAVFTIAVQADGKIVFGGSFTEINGVERLRIARLHANGSLDPTFDPGSGASASVRSLSVLPDGKLIVGGNFPQFNGVARTNIVRLNADGSVDPSFDAGKGPDRPADTVAVQTDGKVLLGGSFFKVNGASHQGLARLNADGSLDPGFVPDPTKYFAAEIVVVQPDGKILVGCQGFSKLVRLNPDGSPDEGFVVRDPHREIDPWKESHTAFNGRYIGCIALQPNGKMLVTGDFTLVDMMPAGGVARLNADGGLNSRFYAGGGGANKTVLAAVRQPDGKILLGGKFTTINGAAYNHVARLNPDGSVDPKFDPGVGADNTVHAVLLQPDGRIVLGGEFENYNKVPRQGLVRLNAAGSLDTSFFPGEDTESLVECLVGQPDGKILVGGNMGKLNGVKCHGIARINRDGTLDTGFHFESPYGHRVQTIALQPDGKVIIGGGYSKDQKTGHGMLRRLDADGKLDETFDVVLGERGFVRSLLRLADGRLLVAGEFKKVGTAPRTGIARLLANGKVDFSFNPGSGFEHPDDMCLALLADGKVLVGGGFDSFNGVRHQPPIRLNLDGTKDKAFSPEGVGVNSSIYTMVVQPNGKIFIGGSFSYIRSVIGNTADRNGIALLHGDTPPAPPLPAPKR